MDRPRVLVTVLAMVITGTVVQHSSAPASAAAPVGGTVWAIGSNTSGSLGDGSATYVARQTVPLQVQGLTRVVAVAPFVQGFGAYALRADGTVWAWGGGAFGALGNGGQTNSAAPIQVKGVSDIKAVSASSAGGYALRKDGTVWAWGSVAGAGKGYLPAEVTGLSGILAVTTTSTTAFFLKADHTVWTWGGAGLVHVTGLSDVIAIQAGYQVTYALRANGTVWAWGDGLEGGLGNGKDKVSASPVEVHNLGHVIQIGGGDYGGYALRANGTVWAWGYGNGGLLGDGSDTNSAVPVEVKGLMDVVQIARTEQGLALRANGTVWAWGQVPAVRARSDVPVEIPGFSHGVAVSSNGSDDYVIETAG